MKKYILILMVATITLFAVGCDSSDPTSELEYLGYIDTHIEMQKDTFNLYIGLLSEPEFGDDQWEDFTFRALELLYDNAETFLALEDVPKAYSKYHKKMSQAMQHQQLFVAYSEESIKQLEPELMTKAQEELRTSNELIEEANTLLP